MFAIARNGDNLTQGLSSIRHSADTHTDRFALTPMLTISIIFAILVALWGFSGSLVTYAKRGIARATPHPRPASQPRPAAARVAASRTRGTRPVASA
jgi:hypothetical protein